ncbi:hypothetical protein BOTBODRAFT_30786 [Botryobasidium botryosum FD-172 SS1]|uniref:Uncharacterized protein n=1 Tax=Botryobasidium botryosum (strain FD-172 SS1) TaxID=930990 RepID=A0A067MY53_BOTB1|nr:hypothetical protein BOTBODRAFT_30786 [Botryobasidium botryosum FD-172 SS1]
MWLRAPDPIGNWYVTGTYACYRDLFALGIVDHCFPQGRRAETDTQRPRQLEAYPPDCLPLLSQLSPC